MHHMPKYDHWGFVKLFWKDNKINYFIVLSYSQLNFNQATKNTLRGQVKLQ